MAIMYLALLRPDNYEAFRRLLKDAPATFKEWEHLRAQKEAHYIGIRWEMVEVEVDPDDFARDCRETNSPYNLHSLDNFAFKIAQRKEK